MTEVCCSRLSVVLGSWRKPSKGTRIHRRGCEGDTVRRGCRELSTIPSYLFLLSYLSAYLITPSDLHHLISHHFSPSFPSALPPVLIPLPSLFYHSSILRTASYCLSHCSLLLALPRHCPTYCSISIHTSFLIPFLATLPSLLFSTALPRPIAYCSS